MKKLMILGASILQLPAIIKAKEMGLQVIAVDMDKNAIGFRYADICLEISTIDIPKVVDAANKLKIDGVMTLASDMPMRSVASVAESLKLVGISKETSLNATNKALMRKSLNEHKIPVPRFFKVDNYDEYIQSVEQFYKSFIVKPADNSGSRGVYFVYDKNDKHLIKEAYEYSKKFSRSGEIVVEDYMEGPEVSVESLSINGKVHVIAITDKLTTGAPNFVEMGHSQPSCLSESVKKKIEEITISAIKSIGIIDGPSHTEIIVTSEGPKIVEIGARLGGDNINTHLVPLSTGIDMVKCSIEIALGINPDINKKFQLGSAIKYFNTKPGLIHSIRGVDEAENIEGIKEITFVKKIGDQAAIINNSADRIGFIIAQSTSSSDAMRICEDAENLIYVDTK